MSNLGIFEKLSHFISVSYEFILKSVKSLNRIFWTLEYWFTDLECQV